MGIVSSALDHLPDQKVFEKLRKLSSGTVSVYGKYTCIIPTKDGVE